MLQLRISSPTRLTEQVLEVLTDPSVSGLAVMRGASVRPIGDVVVAEIARETANDVIERLRDVGVHREGSVLIEPVDAWLSREGLDAERTAPGSSADSVVWAQVAHHAYADAELNWTFLSFLTLATLLAGIAIILDSQILVIGAMVLGPEFGAVAALGLALVRRRYGLLGAALRTLLVGFVVAIVVTTLLTLLGRGLGWVTPATLRGAHAGTAFIYRPDRWSLVIAVIAAAAGVLSLTSARVGGLSGVFISVTTIPAAGNVGLGIALGAWDEVRGSLLQLVVNLTGMALAGWLTLTVQEAVWARVSARRARALGLVPED